LSAFFEGLCGRGAVTRTFMHQLPTTLYNKVLCDRRTMWESMPSRILFRLERAGRSSWSSRLDIELEQHGDRSHGEWTMQITL
jgi:hypothetical protein